MNTMMYIKKNTRCTINISNVQYLVLSHVNASDVALLAYQLTQHVYVPPTPAAQVQDPAALQALWHHQTTAIVPEGEERHQQYASVDQ